MKLEDGFDEPRAVENYISEIKKKLDKLLEEKESITKVVQEVEKRRYDKFTETINSISSNFSKFGLFLVRNSSKTPFKSL